MIEHADHRLSSLSLELKVRSHFTIMLLYYSCITMFIFLLVVKCDAYLYHLLGPPNSTCGESLLESQNGHKVFHILN